MKNEESPSARLIHSLKHQIDELVVQLSLGKAEAADQVERSKEVLREKLATVRNGLPHSEAQPKIAAKLDNLRLQLALGRMESRDTYQDQRDKIFNAIDDASREFHHLDERVREDLNDSAETLKLKLNALAINLGIAAVVAEDELKTRKEELSAKAARLAGKLKDAGSAVGHEAETAAREARIAFDDITDNLKRLFR